MDKKDFAYALKQSRNILMLSQKEIALELQIPVPTYRQYEQASHLPYPKTMKKITLFLESRGIDTSTIKEVYTSLKSGAAEKD